MLRLSDSWILRFFGLLLEKFIRSLGFFDSSASCWKICTNSWILRFFSFPRKICTNSWILRDGMGWVQIRWEGLGWVQIRFGGMGWDGILKPVVDRLNLLNLLLFQAWSSSTPHNGYFKEIGDHNYCRNPENAKQDKPWWPFRNQCCICVFVYLYLCICKSETQEHFLGPFTITFSKM